LANEGFFTAWAAQQPSIPRQWIERAKEPQAFYEVTNRRINWNHTFGFEFSEGDVHRPLIGAGGVEAIDGPIGAFADAQAGMANEEENIATQIIATQEIPL